MKKLVKLLKILLRTKYWRALRFGVGAAVEHEKLLQNLDLSTVIDVGSNRGQFSLVVRYLFPNAKIICFEPLAGPAGIFQSVFAKEDNIYLHNVAIGPESKITDINVSADDDSSSLLPITDLQVSLFPGTAHKETEQVKVVRASDLLSSEQIQAPALLKVDVQGYELQVLQSFGELLVNFEYIYVECSFVELYTGQALSHEVLAFLGDKEWCLNGVYNIEYDKHGKAIQGDFLLVRK